MRRRKGHMSSRVGQKMHFCFIEFGRCCFLLPNALRIPKPSSKFLSDHFKVVRYFFWHKNSKGGPFLQKNIFFKFHGLPWYQIDQLDVLILKLYWKLIYYVCRPRYLQKSVKKWHFCHFLPFLALFCIFLHL